MKRKKKYSIRTEPVRKIITPNLLDDYYLNLVCWGKSNLVAVGLEDSLYFYNFLNRNISRHLYLPKIYNNLMN